MGSSEDPSLINNVNELGLVYLRVKPPDAKNGLQGPAQTVCSQYTYFIKMDQLTRSQLQVDGSISRLQKVLAIIQFGEWNPLTK